MTLEDAYKVVEFNEILAEAESYKKALENIIDHCSDLLSFNDYKGAAYDAKRLATEALLDFSEERSLARKIGKAKSVCSFIADMEDKRAANLRAKELREVVELLDELMLKLKLSSVAEAYKAVPGSEP